MVLPQEGREGPPRWQELAARRSFAASTLPIAKLRFRRRDYAGCAGAGLFSGESIYPLYFGGVCDTNTPLVSGRPDRMHVVDEIQATTTGFHLGNLPRNS